MCVCVFVCRCVYGCVHGCVCRCVRACVWLYSSVLALGVEGRGWETPDEEGGSGGADPACLSYDLPLKSFQKAHT